MSNLILISNEKTHWFHFLCFVSGKDFLKMFLFMEVNILYNCSKFTAQRLQNHYHFIVNCVKCRTYLCWRVSKSLWLKRLNKLFSMMAGFSLSHSLKINSEALNLILESGCCFLLLSWMGALVKYLRIWGWVIWSEAVMYTDVLAASEFLGIVGVPALLCVSRFFRALSGLSLGLLVNSRYILSTAYNSELGAGQSTEC